MATFKLTPDTLNAFLANLAEHGNVRRAALSINVGRMALYERRKADARFADAWDAALEDASDRLLDVARDRATEPQEYIAVGRDGERYTAERPPDSGLLKFLITRQDNRSGAPEAEREATRRVAVQLTDSQLERLIAEQQNRRLSGIQDTPDDVSRLPGTAHNSAHLEPSAQNVTQYGEDENQIQDEVSPQRRPLAPEYGEPDSV